MKMQESAENYLETILVLKQKNGMVRAIDIANELSFTKPSVSVAMKKLQENNYIRRDAEGYIELTDSGMTEAQRVYERHRVLPDCLIALGVTESTAKEDACRIEHVISCESFEKLKKHYMEGIKKNIEKNRAGE